MTPRRFRECLQALNWSQSELADMLGWSAATVRRWIAGDYPAPDEVTAWLDRLARAHEADPPPRRK